jgi:hypothetical protein
MITPIYDMNPPSGLLFTQDFPEMVYEYNVISEIIGQCTARSTVAGDTMDRWCTWDAVIRAIKKIEVAGLYGKYP